MSDTHSSPYTINLDADIIVAAGDLSNGVKGVFDFVKKCQEAKKDYVLVLGNHDFVGASIQEVYNILDENGVNYLKEGKEFWYKGYCFIGGTLFTNFRANVDTKKQVKKHKQFAFDNVFDFQSIYKNGMNEQRFFLSCIMAGHNAKPSSDGFYVTPDDYVELFNKQWNWIQQYRNKNNVIVVTHFPPHLACLDPYWSVHPTASSLNPYFINDLNIKGFKLWLTAHTHTCLDTVADGCRLVVNALGYPAEQIEGNGFTPDKIIELPDVNKESGKK